MVLVLLLLIITKNACEAKPRIHQRWVIINGGTGGYGLRLNQAHW
jgi:hypothetical protein